MSTRSDIIVQRADGSWKRIYCHFDGYLEGVGATLAAHYATQERADALVAPGDLSVLDVECCGAPGHSYANQVDGQSVYYGRDRGEKDTEGHDGPGLAEVWPPAESWTEYTYVFGSLPGGPNEPTWYVGDPDLGPSSLVRLDLALADPENYAPQPNVKSPWGVLWHRDDTRASA